MTTPNSIVQISGEGLTLAQGEATGKSFIHKFGSAPDFDTGDGTIDIWDGANDAGLNAMQYTYSTTADIDTLSSSNVGDTVDIEVQGLDANYDLSTETVTLTGQTKVTLTTPLIRVFRLKNVGSSDLLGSVYCYVDGTITTGIPDTATDVRAIIDNGNNQTLMAIYTVPAGKTAYMRGFYGATAGASRDTNIVLDLKARPFGQVFQLKHRSAISSTATSILKYDYVEPQPFSEKTDIVMRATITESAITGASISAGFDLVLVDN